MSMPRGRRSHLEEAVRLVTEDGPDVVCLQEVPIWGFSRLERWSGMRAVCSGAKALRLPAELGRRVTSIHQGRLRSGVSGQGNAILLRRDLEPLELRCVRISRGLRERRVCQAVRVDGLVVGNLHATADFRRPHIAAGELPRSLDLVSALARPGDAAVVAGDFNLHPERFPELPGWSAPGPRIDHILVRGREAGPLTVWPEERRVVGGRLLSDHAPVELRLT